MPRATYVARFQTVAVPFVVPPRTAKLLAARLIDTITERFPNATVARVTPPLGRPEAPSASSYLVIVDFHGRPPKGAVDRAAHIDGVKYLGMDRFLSN